MLHLAVAGATGRMGRCVLEHALSDARFAIAAALTTIEDRSRRSTLRLGDIEVALRDSLETACDVLIDFTVATGTMGWLEVCQSRRIPMVIGTTGHDDKQLSRIRAAAQHLPIVRAANFSVGINALLTVLGRLARELGDAYDIEIVETHHRHKQDAPSGTALLLLDELLRETGRTRADAVFGRHGRSGERPSRQIGVHAVRMGEIIGRHEIHISGPGETLTLGHTAQSRDAFARGALRAAAWIVGRPPGLYSMRDVLSLV